MSIVKALSDVYNYLLSNSLIVVWLFSLLALAVSIFTIRINQIKSAKEATDAVFAEWFGEDMRNLRKYFFTKFLPNQWKMICNSSKGLKNVDADLNQGEDNLTKLCFFFDKVGWLGASGLIDVDYVLGPMQHTMRRVWLAMALLIENEREKRVPDNCDPVYQFGFEWLFRRSERRGKHQAYILRRHFAHPRILSKKESKCLRNVINTEEQNYQQWLYDFRSDTGTSSPDETMKDI